MKTISLKNTAVTLGLVLLALPLINQPGEVYAGDREWATVGKILTGVVGAGVIYEIFNDNDRYVVSYYDYGPRYPYYSRYHERHYYGRHYAPRRGYRSYMHHRPYYDRNRYYCYR